MLSNIICPAVHISGSQNVYSRAEGIGDHYWPRPVFLFLVRYASVPVIFRATQWHVATESSAVYLILSCMYSLNADC